MKSKENKTPQDYSLEEILAEAKVMRTKEVSDDECAENAEPVAESSITGEQSNETGDANRFGGKSYAELIGEPEDEEPAPPQTKPAVQPMPIVPMPEQPAHPQPSPEIPSPVVPEVPQPSQPAPGNGIRFEQEEEEQPEPKKKRGLFGLFGRKRKNECIYEDEEDIYYGMQLKPIDEYKKGYNENTDIGEQTDGQQTMHPTATFAYLFDETNADDVGDEIAARFDEIRRERQKRVEEVLSGDQPKKKIQPLYDHVNDTLNALPKPVKENTETEIFSSSPKTEMQTAQPAELSVEEVQKKPQPQAKTMPKMKGKPVVAQKSVDSEKTTEYFMQVPKRKSHTDLIPKQEPSASAKIDKTPELIEQTDLSTQAEPEKPTEVKFTQLLEKTEEPAVAKSLIEQEKQAEEPVSQIAVQEQPLSAEQNTAAQVDTEKPFDRKQRIQAVMDTAPKYLPLGKPVHVIELDNLRAVLESEAQGYSVAVKTEPKGKPHLTPVPPIVSPLKPQESFDELNSDVQPQPIEEMPEKNEKKSIGIHKFNITGEEEEEDPDQQEEMPVEQEELDDYNEPSDAPSISNELGATIRELLLRFMVTGICTTLLLIFGFLGEKYQLLPKTISFQLGTIPYFALNLVFLIIAILFCWTTVMNGIKALVTFQANSDSSVAVAAVAALVQSVMVFFVPESVMSGSVHLYSSLAVGALFLNTAGKLSMIKRIRHNFHFVSSPEPKQSVELFDDYNTALQMAKGCVTDTPVIAYQCKTKFFKNFLSNSYEPDPSETASQSIAPVAFICSLVLCIVCLILTKDVTVAITVFAAATCICTPITNMLSVNLPISSLCKFARKCGAMVVGFPTVEQFCNTNAVMLDAKELFPKGTVVLNGIKTFGGQRIDEAIVDATALMCAVGGPLSDVFDQIIKDHRDMLPKIDNPVYEDERGIIGWVSGRRILVGNRDLMSGHGIEPPSRDYEEKYLLGGKQIMYLASGGDLVAMFVLSYNSDKRRALELQRMENNGISLIVRTCDPNITPEFLATCFQLDTHSVRVLPERLGSIYKEIANEERPRTAALFATKGKQTTMLRMLTACVRQKSNVSLAVAMQNVAVVLGFVLVAFLACYSGLSQISTAFLLVYDVFWVFVILLIPRLRKP